MCCVSWWRFRSWDLEKVFPHFSQGNRSPEGDVTEVGEVDVGAPVCERPMETRKGRREFREDDTGGGGCCGLEYGFSGGLFGDRDDTGIWRGE